MKVGDLVKYKAWDSNLGLLLEHNRDSQYLAGHYVIYWIVHPRFAGEQRCAHPADIKKV